MNLVLFGLLTVLVAVTVYTDGKRRKVYNLVLLPCLLAGLVSHLIDGTLLNAVVMMTVAFLFFYLVYVMRMTSPGDVKLFAVMAAITADARVMSGALAIYMVVQFGLALMALWKICRVQQWTWTEVLKRDSIYFITRTGPVIQPIHFPGAIILGGGVWVCDLFFVWVT